MKTITIEATVNSDINKVWDFWNSPKHIPNWAFASDDWEAPYAENDVVTGGKFLTRMSAKDGSASFHFTGVYTNVVPNKTIEYTIEGGRKVTINFNETEAGHVKIVEEFEMETINSEEKQRSGWQSILDNFKKYVEEN